MEARRAVQWTSQEPDRYAEHLLASMDADVEDFIGQIPAEV